MTKYYLPLALVLLAGVGFATTSMDEVDSDGDGLLTLDELQAAYPTLTAEMFETIDTDANGVLDLEEVAAAEEAELLPKQDT